MRNRYVSVSNTRSFLAGVQAVVERGAEEACLLVVDGQPGLGKTETTQWWAIQNDALFLRCKKGWTPNWMLRELLGELAIEPERSFEKMFRQAMEGLDQRVTAAQRTGAVFGIVIDEIDHICRRLELLETLRDLSDTLELPVLMVGMDRVRHQLTRYRQIQSRVAEPVEFRPSTFDDTCELAAGLCEVDVAEDLLAHLHTASGGYVRELKEGLARIERFGRRNADGPVTCAAMAGQVLLIDRRTGKPVTVVQG